MNPAPISLRDDPFRLAAWLMLDRFDFGGRGLMVDLVDLEMAGPFDDGSPGWVGWRAMPDAPPRFSDAGLMSSGVAAALEVVVALAGCGRVGSLDADNTAVLRAVVRRLAEHV